jgi:phasin family protein
MAINFEEYQNFGKAQLEAVQAAATEVSKQLQAIAAETTDYSKKSVENGSAFVEKLLGVKELNEAIALQQEFAKTSYEGFVAQVTKLGELYTNVAKEAFKPVEAAIAKVKSQASAN